MAGEKQRIENRVHGVIFGAPVIGNTLRGLVVEAIVAEALGESIWEWVGADWSSWDFEHKERWTAVEVKQSAALQPWSAQYTHTAKPRFDVALRSGYWYQREGSDRIEWCEERCRPADIYIFAWHGRTDASADQHDPMQWEFYVVPMSSLPPESRTISLQRIRLLAQPCDWESLPSRLQAVDDDITTPRQRKP